MMMTGNITLSLVHYQTNVVCTGKEKEKEGLVVPTLNESALDVASVT